MLESTLDVSYLCCLDADWILAWSRMELYRMGSLFWSTPHDRKEMENKVGKVVVKNLEPVIMAVLLLVVTAYLVDGSFNPFLYFRF